MSGPDELPARVQSPARLLAIAFLAAAIGLAEYARCFPSLTPRWTLLASAVALTICGLGAARASERARVVGGFASLCAGAFGFALTFVPTVRYVSGLDLVLPGLAVVFGVCALSPSTRRSLESIRRARASSAAS